MVTKPKWKMGLDKKFAFSIDGLSDSNFATCPETRHNITGFVVKVNKSTVSVKSGMQKIVAISVTEAETIVIVQYVQEMLYIKKLIESMELKVKLPMTVSVDNRGAVDLVNGWNVNGGTKHIDVRLAFIRELKEDGILQINWIPTEINCADMFTKNVDERSMNQHLSELNNLPT